MHSLVFVIVPPETADVEAEVERLLAGSEDAPDRKFSEYEIPCTCMNRQATFDSYKLYDNSAEGELLSTKLQAARKADDEQLEKELLVQRYVTVKRLVRNHPSYGQFDQE